MTVYAYLGPGLLSAMLSLAFAKIVCKRARIAVLQRQWKQDTDHWKAKLH